MFISFSKTIGKVGGFRIGIGKRVTSKNAWWMSLVICFVAMFQMIWYMCLLSLWMMYAACYCMFWICKATFKGIVSLFSRVKIQSKKAIVDDYSTNSITISPQKTKTNSTQYCSHCGSELITGNSFCIKCGHSIK